MIDLWSNRIVTPRSRFIDAALLVSRILTVLALFPNGARKIATFDATARGMAGEKMMIDGRLFPNQDPLFHFPFPHLFLGGSIVFDLVGSLLIVLGFRTRAVGMFLTGYVILAMTVFHGNVRNAEDAMHIVRNLSLVAGLLMLAAVGGGWWSLDGMTLRRQAPSRSSGQ